MKNKSFFRIILSALLSFAVLSCSPSGTSKVTITIDLGLQNKTAINTYENSIIDRVLCFFAKKAAAAPPSHITSITLNITGSGMDTITQNYTTLSIPDDSITVEVPSGSSRTFEVLAYTPSATLRGVAMLDLADGAIVTIPITMAFYETKIIIPDYTNNRIVQIDDMNGRGWTEASVSQPYDIDFDLLGRLYITHNNQVLRMDDITATPVEIYYQTGNFYAIAVDRVNNLIYFSEYSTLHRCNLDGTGHSTFSLTGITFQGIYGLFIDNAGYLYITGFYYAGANYPVVYRYNTATTTFSQYENDLINPRDVIIKNGYLYVADYDNIGPSPYYDSSKIVRLSLDLVYIDQLGIAGSSTFYGPNRFLAILNNRFYLIDENADVTSETERIVAFDNFNSPIVAFDPSMVGQSPFSFYSNS